MKHTGFYKNGIKKIGALLRAVSFAILACMLLASCSDGVVEQFTMPVMDGGDISAGTEPVDGPDSEVRGVWIASVYNIDYPSSAGLSADKLAAELDAMVENVKAMGLNAIYFQVRPSGDALYDSDIFPVSEYLSGKRGEKADGGFDPLAYLLEAAHAQGIRVHAWVNPLRVTVGSTSVPKTDVNALPENDPVRKDPSLAIAYADGRLYLDAGNPKARELVAAGCREIAEKYAVDGIIFDDYFYPSPVYVQENGKNVLAEFDDGVSYFRYANGAPIADWRRENINKMMELCYKEIKAARGGCQFGVAPFGIWQNDNGKNGGSDTAGNESYSSIYCDTLAFIEGGYVDYVAPQIYWSFDTSVARYDVLVRWWNAQVANTGVDLLISHGAYRYDTLESPEGELSRQILFARSALAYRGSIHYGYSVLKNNVKGASDELKHVYSVKKVFPAPLDNGGEFYIAAPAYGTSVESESVYILGSANTAHAVTLNGKKLSLTKDGSFSAYVSLKNGENRLVFEYGGKTYEHLVVRADGEAKTLDSFCIKDAYPYSRTTVASGNELYLSCIAPAGSTVTAVFGGKDITLLPESAETGALTAVRYSASVVLNTSEKLESLGTVEFTVTRGSEKAKASGGEIRVLGEGCCIPVTVVNGGVYLKDAPGGSYVYGNAQSVGMTEYALAERDGYWLLSMGAYLNIADAESAPACEIPKSSYVRQLLQTSIGGNTVFYTKTPAKAAVSSSFNGNVLTFTIHNCTVTDNAVTRDVQSPVISDVELINNTETGNAELRLTVADTDRFCGYSVSYETVEGVSLIRITVNAPPSIKDGSRPLNGKKIVLDAGHGGEDSGALGAQSGKNEKDINLSVVLSLRDKLTALGAEVILTRDTDTALTLKERQRIISEADADAVISVHQNSMPYSADITSVRGIEAYYSTLAGKALASAVSESLSAALSRETRGAAYMDLAVCRDTATVAALIETGYMTSVEEYARMLTDEGIDTTAEGIKNGIVEYFMRAAKK